MYWTQNKGSSHLWEVCLWDVGGGVGVRAAVRAEVSVERERRGLRARLILRLLAHPAIHYSMDRSRAERWLRGTHPPALASVRRAVCTGAPLRRQRPRCDTCNHTPNMSTMAQLCASFSRCVSPRCREMQTRVTCFSLYHCIPTHFWQITVQLNIYNMNGMSIRNLALHVWDFWRRYTTYKCIRHRWRKVKNENSSDSLTLNGIRRTTFTAMAALHSRELRRNRWKKLGETGGNIKETTEIMAIMFIRYFDK